MPSKFTFLINSLITQKQVKVSSPEESSHIMRHENLYISNGYNVVLF